MSQKILVPLGIALMLGVANPALAQTPVPPPPTGGSTSSDAGAGASTQTDSNTSTQTDAGGASTSSDSSTQTDTNAQAGSSSGSDAGAGANTDASGAATQSGGAAAASGADANASSEISVDITNEQKTEIHQAITEVNVEPVTSVDFDVSVGVTVPSTIKLTPLPPTIIKIVPQFEGYLFFLLPDGRIVIVEPSTLHIVYILTT